MIYKTLFSSMLIVLFFIGCTSDSKTLSVRPSTADFAEVNRGESFDIDLTLKNKYGKNIRITTLDIVNSTDFAIKGNVTTPFDILKGAEYILTITFTPSTNSQIYALLQIEHTGSTKIKEVKLSGIGVPVPRISLSESSYDYRKKLINTTHTHDYEIENIGTSELEISNMLFTGAGASAYSITSGFSPVYIQPSAKHTFTVTFAPSALVTYSADLSIYHNAVNGSKPFVIHIDGEGTDVDPQIQLSVSATWDVGAAPITFPAIRLIKIENTGTDPLTLTSAAFTNSNEFTIYSLVDSTGNTINFPNVIAVGDYVLLYVQFAPTSKTAYNDTLSIVHNGNNEVSPIDISVTGTGRDAITKTFNYSGNIVNWTVPSDIYSLRIETWGAQGGSASSALGGKGARMRGDFIVTPGDIIKVLVGQQGVDSINPTSTGHSGGGGGGSFVATSSDQPMICAGGGGGAGVMSSSAQNVAEGDDGTTAIDGTPGKAAMPFGTNGNGAANQSNTGATGGAGFFTDSADYPSGYGGPASAFVNGGAGAIQTNTGGAGGFGGGGAGAFGGGGGGGYSGGAHGHFSPTRDLGAGGGGSINNGSNPNNSSGVQSGDGKIVISY